MGETSTTWSILLARATSPPLPRGPAAASFPLEATATANSRAITQTLEQGQPQEKETGYSRTGAEGG
jgi:hypothetical protein